MMGTTNMVKLVLAGLVLVVVYRMIVNRSKSGGRDIPGYSFPERYDQDSDGEGYDDEYYGDMDMAEEYMDDTQEETYDDGEETYDDGEETYDDGAEDETYDDAAEEETYDDDETTETYDDETTETYDEGGYPFGNSPPNGGVDARMVKAPSQAPRTNPSNWKDFAPKNALDQNFLDGRMQIGVDTVSSSLKNPSYDLRNNVPIPKNYKISPWMQSNIDPDLARNQIF